MGIFGNKKEDIKEGVSTEKKVEKTSKKKDKSSAKDVASTSSAYGTIVAPIVTEKSHAMASEGKYTFRVEKTATKKDVKRVVQEMYKVDVENVNMIVVKPKRRTVKYDRGYQKLYKKAIVTVKEGQHIAVFEGV
ncbi:MAG: 50S ribosomal protein L23 [Candidatus Moraniibacteriota bacterium]|jgi:large subunit ribosomal protein L23